MDLSLSKTIKYTDYNGVERKETHYFNYNKAEIAEMELSTAGGLSEMIKKITEAQDGPSIMKLFKDIILGSYGVKSPDGKQFIKSDELSKQFSQTEAYSELFMELVTNADAAAEFVSGLPNSASHYVIDPHPALDYARYRIIATETATGAVSYYDVPGYPINEPGVIIQWSEAWSAFDVSDANEADVVDTPPWSGSLIRIPYNIDVSDKADPDVTLVKYAGRKRQVSYYGTQLGESSTWKVEIPADDNETLYALRRLMIWTGDVYVREPSGSGYWANVKVSFSRTHCALTIPVTFDITRVEGGM